MRFVLFFLLFFTVIGGGIAYTWIRGAAAFASIAPLRIVYHIATVILVITFFAGFFLGNYLPTSIAKSVSFVGNTYFLLLVYLLLGVLIIDLFLLVNRFFNFIPDPSKFRLIISLLIFTVITVSMIAGRVRFNNPQRVELNLFSNKPEQGKTIKIVAVSDIHLGVSIDKKMLRNYVDIINSEKPDIVLIAGDLIDRSLKPLVAQKMDEELRQLKAPMGVYAVYGNHDHFTNDPESTRAFFSDAEIILLNDTASLVADQFYVVGRDDQSNPNRKSLQEVMMHLDSTKPVLLMDHQPTKLEESVFQNVDFHLSGHTHNGQFFPINLIVNSMFQVGYGYKNIKESHIYVTSGLGIWGPQYRIGTQSEWVVINFSY